MAREPRLSHAYGLQALQKCTHGESTAGDALHCIGYFVAAQLENKERITPSRAQAQQSPDLFPEAPTQAQHTSNDSGRTSFKSVRHEEEDRAHYVANDRRPDPWNKTVVTVASEE